MTPEALRAFRFYLEKTASVDASGHHYEEMDDAKWKQTAKDLPLVIAGSALGYGVGKTLAEEIGRRAAKEMAGGNPPLWIRHLPLAAQTASSIGAYAFGRSREGLRMRREAASAAQKRSG